MTTGCQNCDGPLMPDVGAAVGVFQAELQAAAGIHEDTQPLPTLPSRFNE